MFAKGGPLKVLVKGGKSVNENLEIQGSYRDNGLWSPQRSSEGPSPASLEPEQSVLPGWEDRVLWMREHQHQLQYAVERFENSVSEFGMALVRLEALAAGFSELLHSEGGLSHHD